ncbi:protein of unknown function [Burkholderia multivorans]
MFIPFEYRSHAKFVSSNVSGARSFFAARSDIQNYTLRALGLQPGPAQCKTVARGSMTAHRTCAPRP